MNDVSRLLTDDHIDLLTSAAARWHVLTSTAGAALSPVETTGLRATATTAGRALRQENLAALTWLTERGRSRAADRLEPRLYEHSRIAQLRPVEVVKAAHAAEEACRLSPTWPDSFASRLLQGVVRAACHRLEGYTTAPWAWTRPERRDGPPVAAGGRWRPVLPGVRWIDPCELEQHWANAALVLISTEVVDQVPAGLAARAGVFLLTDQQSPDDVWHAVMSLGMQTLVLWWPTCQAWLADQVADPAAQYVEHRS